MHKKIQDRFDRLEQQRLELLSRVKQVPEKFDIKPDEKNWSVHQVLAHLIAAEKLSVQYLEKKIQGIEQAGDTGLWEEIKMGALKISQRLPIKYKAPKKVVEGTPSYPYLEALVEDWSRTREQLKGQLSRIKDQHTRRKIFKHVVAGKLNISHALEFLAEHVNHHLPQLDKLLK